MYCNTSCTLYLKSLSYVPLYISSCFLTNRKVSNFSKNGLSYYEEAFVMANMESKTFNEGEDFLVEGQCTDTINTQSEATFSTSMKALRASHRVYTIMCADYKNFGSSEMRHVEISCK